MPSLVFYLAVIAPSLCMAADAEVSDPTISVGGIVAIVLLVIFSLVLLGSCIYQSRRLKNSQESQHRILRCGGCRRAFRVPSSVEGAEFMCSRCVTEGRRRMSEVLEEERLARFARMRESANQTVKLQRVTSTFFKLARRSQSNITSANGSKIVTDSLNNSVVEDGKPDSGTECKICFDDESCIVLLPCCHSGLCEGCAKDLVTMTKECYICRQEVELIAKVKKTTRQSGSQVFDDPHLSACLVAPDSLHHMSSRRNTFDELNASSPTPDSAPMLEMTTSRRSTLHPLDPILVPATIDEEEPSMSQPSVEVV